MGQQFGDTTLTKVFVGGLAWELQKEALREHFEKYGEILEAVVISDKISGRSKGYGFVTFKEAEAAKAACEDAAPVINGRRANCNLASLGAKRGGVGIRHSPPSTPAPLASRGGQPPPPPGMAVGSRVASPAPPAAQWYYPNPSGTPPPPFQLHQYHHGIIPFYSASAYACSTNYPTGFGYNSKLSPNGGGGFYQYHGQFSYPAAAQGGGMVAAAAANGMLPMYPLFHWRPHQYQGTAIPTVHFLPSSATAAIPTIISAKPTAIHTPATVCVAVEQVKGAN